MLGPQLLVAVVAAVFVGNANAAKFTANPFTPGGDSLSLDHKHPAFGAEAPRDSLSYAVDVYGNSTDDENREANSATDLQRLNTFFKKPMVVNYQELTKYSKGAAASAPWPSSYWPTYEDGINYQWNPQDKMPPSEKYARAYGLDPKGFMTKVSQVSGILSQSTRQSCSTTNDCARLQDGSACAKRAGESRGYCIPTWFGVCHAWAPAAIEEREPRCPVTKNGVTFQPFDIKALITQMYDGSSLNTVFTGSRFNGPDSPINMDSDGRYNDPTRRDMGPGFFHIAIHNIMGIRKSSFVVDVDQDSQVWNQPVRSYEVISATELTPEQAAQTFFPPKTTYTFNRDAKKTVFIQLQFQYIVEAGEDGALVSTGKVDSYTTTVYYEYLLELDGNGNIIGGEWVRNSRKTHPDFLWFPESTPTAASVSDIGIKYKDVRELLDASADCKAIDGTSTTLAPGSIDAPSASTAPVASSAAPAPAPAPAPATPVSPATAAPSAPSAPATAAPSPVAFDPSTFDFGTVNAGTLPEIYDRVAELMKKWLAGFGRW